MMKRANVVLEHYLPAASRARPPMLFVFVSSLSRFSTSIQRIAAASIVATPASNTGFTSRWRTSITPAPRLRARQTNGICERFHKTVLNEFYRVAFRKKVYRSIDELRADLDC
jgi:transposase InsO family protein